MKRLKLRSMLKNQRGFTLIEVIVALAITSLISTGAAMATMQIVDQGARNTNYTTASRHTMNAIHWISRDAQMAQTVETNGSTGFPLVLGWTEWDNTSHEVTYTTSGDEMMRSYSIDGGTPSETLIAQYLNLTSANTTCATDNGTLSLTITATVGTGPGSTSVTKVREITPRPNL